MLVFSSGASGSDRSGSISIGSGAVIDGKGESLRISLANGDSGAGGLLGVFGGEMSVSPIISSTLCGTGYITINAFKHKYTKLDQFV